MTNRKALAALLALAGSIAPALGQAADDVASLRAELQALKNEYSTRVDALEAAHHATRSRHRSVQLAEAAPAPQPAPARSGRRGTAFNPAMSVILAGNYADTCRRIPAPVTSPGSCRMAARSGPGERSFNLGESELTLSANVDPYFFANVTAAHRLATTRSASRRRYVRTLALPDGLQLKGGRFFSGVGYLNEIHAHAWDFIDQPLVYQAFFGGQFAQDGAAAQMDRADRSVLRARRRGRQRRQLSRHAPQSQRPQRQCALRASRRRCRRFDQLARGPLVARSRAAGSRVRGHRRGRPAGARCLHGQVAHLDRRRHAQMGAARRLHAAAAEAAGRIPASQGKRRAGVRSATAPRSPAITRARSPAGTCRACISSSRAGGSGARYDSLDSGSPRIGLVQSGLLPREAFPALLPDSPERVSLMLDWSPSEFSRLRAAVRLGRRRAMPISDRQLFLQYIYGIGAHGAHKF